MIDRKTAGLTSKGARTRSRITAVAARLFDERGYHATSLHEVAEAAGISKATIYHHFKTKDEILVDIFQGLIRTLTARQEERWRQGAGSAEEMLRAVIGDLLELIELNPSHLRVFVEQLRRLPPTAQEGPERERLRFQDELRRILEAGITSGEFEVEGDPELAAAAILGMCWTYHWFPPRGAVGSGDVATAVTTLVLRGLRRR
ncbi:TetR/AcrR family transcriptional regulator [Nonomuraea sp. NPDC002799]